MSHQRIPAGILFLLLLSLTRASAAQDHSLIPKLSMDVDLVLVNATVTEPAHNRPVRGLEREDFQVWEDKIEQNIAYFSSKMFPPVLESFSISAAA